MARPHAPGSSCADPPHTDGLVGPSAGGPTCGLAAGLRVEAGIGAAFHWMGDTGLEPVTSALSRRRSPS